LTGYWKQLIISLFDIQCFFQSGSWTKIIGNSCLVIQKIHLDFFMIFFIYNVSQWWNIYWCALWRELNVGNIFTKMTTELGSVGWLNTHIIFFGLSMLENQYGSTPNTLAFSRNVMLTFLDMTVFHCSGHFCKWTTISGFTDKKKKKLIPTDRP
jgi:hypothetical protein